MKRWFSQPDATRILGTSKTVLLGKAKRGTVPSVRLGSRWFFWLDSDDKSALPGNPHEFMTAAMLADEKWVSPRFASHWLKEFDLPYVERAGCRFYRWSDIQARWTLGKGRAVTA